MPVRLLNVFPRGRFLRILRTKLGWLLGSMLQIFRPCASYAGFRSTMPTILLLFFSNIFMTFAWYGHLKYLHSKPLWAVVLISWGIAFFEYCLMVPANRLGYATYTGFQLKVIQEVITLIVFSVFAILVLKEKLAWNYVASFAFIMLAVVFAFGFKTAPTP
jgi:uncharacterized protein (DUF486 family)